jgi:hypothetical protein
MVIRIFDNKGETMDRYTVVIDESYYSMSENALSPDGFNQYGGQRIDLEDKSGYIRKDRSGKCGEIAKTGKTGNSSQGI